MYEGKHITCHSLIYSRRVFYHATRLASRDMTTITAHDFQLPVDIHRNDLIIKLKTYFVLTQKLVSGYVTWAMYCEQRVCMFVCLSVRLHISKTTHVQISRHFLHCVSKKRPTFKLSLTLSNLNRFSKFLHCWKAYEICYKRHMTIPTLS